DGQPPRTPPSTDTTLANPRDDLRQERPVTRAMSRSVSNNPTWRDIDVMSNKQSTLRSRGGFKREGNLLHSPSPSSAHARAQNSNTPGKSGKPISNRIQRQEHARAGSTLQPGIQELAASEEQEDAPVVVSFNDADKYNFRATEETAPTDHCLYASVFEAPLNESAADYLKYREHKRLRRIEADLLLGSLGMLNMDESISVQDMVSYTENQLAKQGVSQVDFVPEAGGCTITADGVRSDTVTISTDELPQDEILIFNGVVAPRVQFPSDSSRHTISNYEEPLERAACRLCIKSATREQFRSRHKCLDIRHDLIHEDEDQYRTRNSGNMYENVFSISVDLQSSSYGRQHNPLPTAEDVNTAISIVCDDDEPLPTSPLGRGAVIANAFELIRSASLAKLLKLYFCMKNSVYDYTGSVIRQVSMCE
ncbi:hypothetical protein H0H81_006940, partial [Sphagnurus paluster]